MEANFRQFINNTFMKWKKKVAHNFDKKKKKWKFEIKNHIYEINVRILEKKVETLRLKITIMR